MERKGWVKFTIELVQRDETICLAAALGTRPAEAAAYIALLICLGLEKADDYGRIDHLTVKYIESSCAWTGERGALLHAFGVAGVVTGQHENDENPLTIAPATWELAAPIVAKRHKDADRQQDYRATNKAPKNKKTPKKNS